MNDYDFNDRAFLGNKIHKIHSLKYQVDTGPQDSMDLEVWRNCQNGKLQAFPELQYQIKKKKKSFLFLSPDVILRLWGFLDKLHAITVNYSLIIQNYFKTDSYCVLKMRLK